MIDANVHKQKCLFRLPYDLEKPVCLLIDVFTIF